MSLHISMKVLSVDMKCEMCVKRVTKALNEQGVFTATYRLVDTGAPVYVNMKVTRMQPGSSKIILGVSIIDAQMRQKERYEKLQNERAMLVRVMALSDGYISLFTVNPETGHFLEYTRSYATLGTPKEGDDFFGQSIENVPKVLYPDDQAGFLERFSKENIMREIRALYPDYDIQVTLDVDISD